MRYFITAIGTDSGKTLTSAVFTERLGARYWKPIQAGFPRDTETVKALVSNTLATFEKESYLLQLPASPHASARAENIQIKLEHILLPSSETKNWVIEGAGGVMVPLNEEEYVIDIAQKFDAKIILVSNLYLGSINHTLLTHEYLCKRKLSVSGLVFNGPSNAETEQIIEKKTELPVLLRIPQLNLVNQATIRHLANQLQLP